VNQTAKILILLLLSSFTAFADQGFDAANKLYESGEYSEAAAAYGTVISSGNACAEAYYNLGNACLKDKKVGLAILNYEKALRITPRDADIKYNLEFARSFIKDNAGEDAAAKFLAGSYGFLTLNELCVLFSAAFALLMGALIFRVYRKNEFSYWLVFGVSLLFAIILLFFGARIRDNEINNPAIVVALSVEAKSEPKDSNPAAFTLPEGKKVFLTSRRDFDKKTGQKYAEVLLKGENIKGWVTLDSLAEIK